ncbi:PorT family protein [Flavobacteriaceae bacterium]|nr:PorT family protein [Flavobacteriaceae bacterium]MBT4231417.1 PorT family protein [Flavobacteriaceae bacterium]MBT7574015.1 PorT family protein [Flavobacteriaceae bacterium]MBT7984550.1 PorT family protein [Flavobacteriaceae bacterium]MDA7731773.1 PorT family protein [Flavobacteriaceae bacterium]
MKKLNLLFFIISLNAFSQFEYGIKGGISFNSNLNISANIESISNPNINIFESRNGQHIGVFLKLTINDFFIRPELIYSKIKNSYDVPIVIINKSNIVTDFNQHKIDIPMMFGYKVFGLANIFAGPRFEFIRGVSYDNIDLDDLKNQYNLGLQYGIGLKFGKFEFDLRAERGFTKNEINFMENQAEIKNQYITSQGRLYLLGVSYYF